MTSWAAGYVADIGYTFGYYADLNPLRARLALLSNGLACPNFNTACELGFGQGLSINLHASASAAQWYGTDFNPTQAGFAQELAVAAGSSAKLYDQAFAEFCTRPDLPDFDMIGLHGIWSWISDENRAIIVDFVRRKLKVGGVLYVSYNTLPGWAAFAPMRHLMTKHADVMGSEGKGIINRIDGAMEFAEKLLATNPAFARANPLVGDRLQKMKAHNRHYLAHEYFNHDWHPMHFATMQQWLEPAKIQYACSANYLDHTDAVNLTVEQRAFLAEIPDMLFRQSVRDFMVNQQFRKDYWVKGPRKLGLAEQAEALRAQRVVLTTHRADISLRINGSLGEVSLNDNLYVPILDLLADHKPKSFAEMEFALRENGIKFPQLLEMVMLMIGAGHVSPVWNNQDSALANKTSKAINAHLQDKARGSGEIGYLASPLTGGGVPVDRFQQMFLKARHLGRKTPEEWASFCWETLVRHGQKIVKDGKALETDDENLAELLSRAQLFEKKQLPVLKALQVA
jgi:SAM-dependent methyltransferase